MHIPTQKEELIEEQKEEVKLPSIGAHLARDDDCPLVWKSQASRATDSDLNDREIISNFNQSMNYEATQREFFETVNLRATESSQIASVPREREPELDECEDRPRDFENHIGKPTHSTKFNLNPIDLLQGSSIK